MSEAASTKADDVALELEQAIVSGELAPGTVLRQEQLSARYGVSRTPIREALRRVAALGLVSFEPNRGVRVRTLTRAELREAFLIRAELESLATEIAASGSRAPTSTSWRRSRIASPVSRTSCAAVAALPPTGAPSWSPSGFAPITPSTM